MDGVVDVVVALVPSLMVFGPAKVEALALSAAFVTGADTEAINRAATGVSGFVLGAQRGPGSEGRVPTFTVAPP